MGNLKRIGFFHFGKQKKADPIDSLRKSLSTESSLSDCLIVLPEAFNVPGGYLRGDSPDVSVCGALQGLSTEKSVAFVAGMIEPRQGSTLGCNSAFLIDGACCHLLSRKRQCFRSDLYRVCQFDAPIAHRGLRIGALVCEDANCKEGHRADVLKSIEALTPADPIVLCVPACMTSTCPEVVVRDCWPGTAAMVIANGDFRQSSVIRIASLAILEPAERETNTIRLKCYEGVARDPGDVPKLTL
ncbi:MAG: nitrilase-related carbon-nitrogen hydrolase [Bryobacteraceae bacterium]|jgi:hypothetical protein